jgi:uncharacterized SAM-binding protein YcdF (DUF218 family)
LAFIAGKLVWLVLAPGNLLLLLLLAGAVLAWRRRRRGRVPITAAALGFLVFAVLPLGTWFAAPLENRFPAPRPMPEQVDGIVLLSGAIDPVLSAARGQVAIGGAAGRVIETIALARRYPAARIVVSGGEGTMVQHGQPEADATKALMIALGVAAERIELESGSRSTAENAIFSYQLVRPPPGAIWLLVTSAMHMPRAIGSFRRAGWRILPYPVDYRTLPEPGAALGFDLVGGLSLPTYALKEWVGLAAYYARGRTDTLLPGPAAE